MTEPGAQQFPSPTTTRGTITLLEGTAFCVCLPSGDIVPGGTEGVFYRDTRLASRWELLVDGDPVEPMAVLPGQPFFATFVGRSHPRPGRAESTVLVTRTRYVGAGMREDVAVQNFAEESIGVRISVRAESDLAGIFDVKSGRSTGTGQPTVDTRPRWPGDFLPAARPAPGRPGQRSRSSGQPGRPVLHGGGGTAQYLADHHPHAAHDRRAGTRAAVPAQSADQSRPGRLSASRPGSATARWRRSHAEACPGHCAAAGRTSGRSESSIQASPICLPPSRPAPRGS